jgi:hypothetical protein
VASALRRGPPRPIGTRVGARCRRNADRPPRGPVFPTVEPLTDERSWPAVVRPEEAFIARREASRLLVTPQRRAALERIVLHATSLRIPIVEVEGGTLTALSGFDGHQGVALVVAARRYATLDDVLARAAERGEPPFVLALDSLEDPQNVGTLLRSAEAAGVHGVIFPTHRQAPLTPAAVKASAGAVEQPFAARSSTVRRCARISIPATCGSSVGMPRLRSLFAKPTCADRSSWSSGARARASGRRSDVAATSSSGSRCAGRSGR